ncbi:MAG: DUF1127 domain-containing protein [Proteobacteria bacterium]|nr:DUF1127 domain-containing protein [Pseudomonadota bacterium]MBI3496662.1 DUF1127 domain-containing protein [Pseudomonadota bacterium]
MLARQGGERLGIFHGLIRRLWQTLLVWQARANSRHHLSMMGERELSDIGISRLDAGREIDKPFWRA